MHLPQTHEEILQDWTGIKASEWEYYRGPESGCGEDYYYNHRDGHRAYFNLDQDQLTCALTWTDGREESRSYEHDGSGYRWSRPIDSDLSIPEDEWTGAVHCATLRPWVFPSVSAFKEAWLRQHAESTLGYRRLLVPFPEFVLPALKAQWLQIDLDILAEALSDDAPDDWDGRIEGWDKLSAAIHEFNEKNKHQERWLVGENRMIKINPWEPNVA